MGDEDGHARVMTGGVIVVRSLSTRCSAPGVRRGEAEDGFIARMDDDKELGNAGEAAHEDWETITPTTVKSVAGSLVPPAPASGGVTVGGGGTVVDVEGREICPHGAGDESTHGDCGEGGPDVLWTRCDREV